MSGIDYSEFYRINDKGKVSVSIPKLMDYLQTFGFGQFCDSPQATKNGSQIKIDYKNKRIYPSNEIYAQTFIKNDIVGKLDEDEDAIYQIRDKTDLVSSLDKRLENIQPYSEDGEEEGFDPAQYKQINIHRDTKDRCSIPFQNGVVVITKDDITLKKTDAIDGYIWSSAIVQNNIKLEEADEYQEGMFYRFVNNAFKNIKSVTEFDHIDRIPVLEDQKKGMQSAFGFLIHDYNDPSQARVVTLVDAEADNNKKALGRTGKSLMIEALKHIGRHTCKIEGAKWTAHASDASRFRWQSVSSDHRIVFIDEVNPEFDMRLMFSSVTSDMEVERKKKDPIIIPLARKPKFALTTNYITAGTGESHAKRMHIVETQNFWNRVVRTRDKGGLGAEAIDLLDGRLMFQEWKKNDPEWQHFFNYMFYCVQQHLKNDCRLQASTKSTYDYKLLVKSIEGRDGTGEFVDWFEEWLGTNMGEQVSIDETLQAFINEFPEKETIEGGKWDRSRFKEAVEEYCSAKNLEFNASEKHKGDTWTKRRIRKDKKEQMIITSALV